jgi:hypothetical protein
MSKTSANQRANQKARQGGARPPARPVPRASGAAKAYPRRTQRAVAKARRHRRNTTFWIVISVVVVIGIAATVAVAGGGSSSGGGADRAASPALVKPISSVPADVFSAVGKGSASSLPNAIQAPALTKDGKPRIVFIGSEYCPYCAAERWGLAVALSRFGTFTGLRTTHSSSTDLYPDTNTLSFHGAKFTSPYITFESVELETNQPSGSGYKPLETPTAEQAKLMAKYDAPPYVAASDAGAIPFIDFGGTYMSTGATYSVQVLSGKSHQQIADALSDPTDPIAQGVIGVANGFTATICKLTNNQPASVCATPAIQKLAAQIK